MKAQLAAFHNRNPLNGAFVCFCIAVGANSSLLSKLETKTAVKMSSVNEDGLSRVDVITNLLRDQCVASRRSIDAKS